MQIQLPDAPTIDGKQWTIKTVDSTIPPYAVTVTTVSGTVVIEQDFSVVMNNRNESVTVTWTASQSQYFITDHTYPSTLDLPYSKTGSGTLSIGNVIVLASYSASNSPALDGNYLMGNNSGQVAMTGQNNFAAGNATLSVITSGSGNTAIGVNSLKLVDSGSENVALGSSSLTALTSGQYNISLGYRSLGALISGSYNTAIGWEAGLSLGSSNSYNVLINSLGFAGDSNVLRIGDVTGSGNPNYLSKAFICGIDGVNVGSTAKIVTMGTSTTANQLGTATLTAGTIISITPTANTITISAIPAPFATTVTSASTVAMAINNAYASSGPSLVTFTLPTSTTVGSVVQVMGSGTGGWKINQNSGQQIIYGSLNTTLGAGGSLSSTANGDSVNLVCLGTQWIVNSSIGNIFLV